MMLRKAALALAAAAALTLPLFAQTAGTDTLSALLTEVRQLRIAMERAATITPEIQLLGARLAVQNERLSRATSEHQSVQDDIERLTTSIGQMSARLQELEDAVSRESNPAVQRALALDQRALKHEVESQTAQETRLRAREAELANLVAAEQGRWLDLNARLDDLERTLGTQPRR